MSTAHVVDPTANLTARDHLEAAAWRGRGTDVPRLLADAGRWLAQHGQTEVVELRAEVLPGRVDIVSRPRARGRDACGWESLTDAELRVVSLVAEGLTNREAAARLLLSPHTVNSHVRHVFTKLDINRRVELVSRFLARQEPAGSRVV